MVDNDTPRDRESDDEETEVHSGVPADTLSEDDGGETLEHTTAVRQSPPSRVSKDTVPEGTASDDYDPTRIEPSLPLPFQPLDSEPRPMTYAERYQHIRELGGGGMGEVRLYHDGQIGRRVAMKVLRPEHQRHEMARMRFVREARVQGQLEHPSVVPVYDLGVEQDDTIWFTMKRVRGVTLEDIVEGLRRGDRNLTRSWSRRRLLSAFSQVCLAVDYAHQRHVLHRDLKPSNVMLGDHGEVYVLDWGLARARGMVDVTGGVGFDVDMPVAASHETQHGMVLGTPGYMAPEQMRGEHEELGPSADIYSLGAILFELLTHTELHPRTTPGDIIRSTIEGVDARPSVRAPERDVAPELDEIVVRAAALDPEERFHTAREMHGAIERYLDGERDELQRRKLADQHARRAVEAAHVATAGGEAEARRLAMRSVGRALALDPENETAARTLVRLLTEPPEELPAEVVEQMERASSDRIRWVGRVAGIAYTSMLLYLPFFFWLGIRSWIPIVVFHMLALGSAAACFAIASARRASPNAVVAVMFISNACCAVTAALFGPLVVTPTIVAVNAIAYTQFLGGTRRVVTIVTACVTILLVVALGVAGALPVDYVFDASGMVVTPGAVELPQTATLVFMTVIAIGAILTGTLSVTKVRDALVDAERRLYLHSWHVGQLVPGTKERLSPPAAVPPLE